MNYLETYCIIGFLFTMLFEYIFETFNDGEFKYSGFGERLIFFFFWPLILFIMIKELIKNENIF
jgi:hypothetical protein